MSGEKREPGRLVLVPGVPQPITLRDWFAGQALAGLLASEAWCRDHPDIVVRAAYEQADAMLEVRKGGDS